MPFLSAVATRAASGRNSSSTGPTAPAVPASFSVWHRAQGGVALFVNSALPRASWLASSSPRAAPTKPRLARNTVATSGAAAARWPLRDRRSDNSDLHRGVGPAVVVVAVRVLEALLRLRVAGGIDGTA